MTRLSCHRFRANEVRLQLSVLAYNLGNLWRRMVLPKRIDHWSLTSLQQRLVKTGGRLVKHAQVLLAPVGRRASDAPRVRGDIAADLGVAFACRVAIDFWREAGEEGGREGKVPVQPAGKQASSGFRSVRKGQNDRL
jgi:Transposase DDE domain group 1